MKSALDRYTIDQELKTALAELLARFPGGFNAPNELAARRLLISGFLQEFPKSEEVTREDLLVDASTSDHKIPIRIYRPIEGLLSDGVIFTIHGGGMVMGGIIDDDANAVRLCREFGITVVAIDYRLAPEHPFPAGLDDCTDVARWIFAEGSEFGWNLSRSILFGGSAGGGLTIATAMSLRDRGERTFTAMVTPYPMVDYRNTLPSTRRIVDLGVWDRKANEESWSWYLNDRSAAFLPSGEIHPYASPLHAKDLSKLPPLLIDVGDADLFLDENLELVTRLISAGVSVEFHLYPGAFHASELFAPEARISDITWRNRFDFMRRWLS